MTKHAKTPPTPREIADEALDAVTGAGDSLSYNFANIKLESTRSAVDGDPDKPVIIGSAPNSGR